MDPSLGDDRFNGLDGLLNFGDLANAVARQIARGIERKYKLTPPFAQTHERQPVVRNEAAEINLACKVRLDHDYPLRIDAPE